MFGGVLVLGGVATTDMAAGQAQPQMHPGIANFKAIFATPGAGRNLLTLVKVRTLLGHITSLSLFKRTQLSRDKLYYPIIKG
jgi:hypothetical protein